MPVSMQHHNPCVSNAKRLTLQPARHTGNIRIQCCYGRLYHPKPSCKALCDACLSTFLPGLKSNSKAAVEPSWAQVPSSLCSPERSTQISGYRDIVTCRVRRFLHIPTPSLRPIFTTAVARVIVSPLFTARISRHRSESSSSDASLAGLKGCMIRT